MAYDIRTKIEKEIEEYIEENKELISLNIKSERDLRYSYFNNWPDYLPGTGLYESNFNPRKNAMIDKALPETELDLERIKELAEKYEEARGRYVPFFEGRVLDIEGTLAAKALRASEDTRAELIDYTYPLYIKLREQGNSWHDLVG